MTTVIVCGGREFADVEWLNAELDWLHEQRNITRLVHGAAEGADELADQWARAKGISVQSFVAQWRYHGRSAGAIRNQTMLYASRPDLVFAFPGGRGTDDMVRRATVANVEVIKANKHRRRT